MFVARGRPHYGWAEIIGKLPPEAFEKWKAGANSLREFFKPETTAETVKKDCSNQYGDLIMDAEEMGAWNDAGVTVEVSRVKGLASNSKELAQTVFQVHVANVGLMQIQLVEVLEDCCTNELQDWLKRGWRIIAVCPPNNTRRPAYVIGHTDTEAK